MPRPVKRLGAAAIIAAIVWFIHRAISRPSDDVNQYDSSSGIGDSACIVTRSRSMSSMRRATSHERESISRNGLSAIITVASLAFFACMHGQRELVAGDGLSGKRAGTMWE